MTAHHDDRTVRNTGEVVGEVSEFDVGRARDVPRRVFAGLADVQDRVPGVHPFDHLDGPDQGQMVSAAVFPGPGGVAAFQFPGEGIEADLGGGGSDVGRVLFGGSDDHYGPFRGGEPSQPGGEDRAERD